MSKGTYLTSNWLIFAITLIVVVAMVGFSMMQGHMAFEMAGLELSFTPHEDGGLRLAVIRTADALGATSL
ncbi:MULTISPECIES: hypothetical protein [unclassified Hyphomonas]|jgi:hypothetical protein|uniref:hypothetical protein n=1 Tax=unclassified Hyphomonas TaxID=2630699 RepID=UPI000458ECAC|nr:MULTISPECIES: hypothetical protein [unclassified Hyphomonas]KCZ49801.1 hypothetical protein HY17_01510 [Hyphomonas sp. CY54-11-8]RAN41100.1 hypothetical protein HY26_10655 [Hyphomonas sp. GM-8P]